MSWALRLVLTLLLAQSIATAGCDAFFVGFVSNPGGSRTVSGTVSIVQLSFIHDVTGQTIQSTAVTFLNPGTATTVNFCGDEHLRFPLNSFVRADFNTGALCSTLVAVAVVS